MNDYEAIRSVLAEYCFGTDSGDRERWLATMTEDVVWDGGPFGKFEGREGGRAYIAGSGDAATTFRHLTVNSVIRVEGDTARAYSYILLMNQGEALTPAACLFYEDDLQKAAGGWLIKRRLIHTAPPRIPAGF